MLGGEPRKLTDHLAQHARFSPDGRAVVFSDSEYALQNRCGWAKFAQDLGRARVN